VVSGARVVVLPAGGAHDQASEVAMALPQAS
jgi:hypothetical protein